MRPPSIPTNAIPESYNYIAAFLTFRCPFHCSFCINKLQGGLVLTYHELPGDAWIDFLTRLDTHGVPITLQGGEPGNHPDFIRIVKEVSQAHPVDLLTNLAFNLNDFVREVDPERLNREAPYAPIRVSYHPEQFTLDFIMKRVLFLQDAGFRVGLYGVLHPDQHDEIMRARDICLDRGIDFRTKPLLGWHNGTLYGDYAYEDACGGSAIGTCDCAGSELLVAPDGTLHRCHHFLYNKLAPIGHIHDTPLPRADIPRPCAHYGLCNPCDIKIKNNRFQQFGHVAMQISNIQTATHLFHISEVASTSTAQ